MSTLNQSGEEQVECPLCMEPLEVDDLHFYPCTCGYQICRFCWNRIREGENGLCPACRKAYPENPADFTPLSQEQVAAIKTEKKAREQKRRNKTLESRRALANVRVVQNNLVFVVGLPVRLADPEILKRQEYFGKYGKIHKVVINQSSTYAGPQGPSATAYVTYVSSADALRAIQGVNNVTLDGRVLKGSLGTTKYCANFMKNQPCPKPDCMYLHELGDPKASFTKEEMHAGLHQVYERKLHNALINSQRDKPTDDKQNSPGNSSTNGEKSCSKDGNPSNFIPTTVVTSSHINIVNSSKSKKESQGGSGGGGGSGSGSGASSSNGKEAWPSLGSSPPSDSPARDQPSPNPTHSTVKSQENGSSESSSPILQSTAQHQQLNQTKHSKDSTENGKTSRNSKDITNGPHSKKSKSDKHKKNSNSNNDISDHDIDIDNSNTNSAHTQANSVFDSDNVMQQGSYLTNELDELESDRHSLLENHDLLDNSDHSLLDDDNTHNLLDDASNDVLMMARHRDMLAGLVDSNHLMPHNMSKPMVNGFGLVDRGVMGYLGSDRQVSQMGHAHGQGQGQGQGQSMEAKELLYRERSRSEMLMRQRGELLRHPQHAQHPQHQQHPQHPQQALEAKHYLHAPSIAIGLDAASELLGANYHQNPNILPPFGMRVDNSMAANSLGAGSMSASSLSASHMANPLVSNSLGGSQLGAGAMSAGSLGGSQLGGGFMLGVQQNMQHNQQHMQPGLVNGFDASQTATSEGRYLAENMDKFFTDFHKTQQMRLLLRGAPDERRYLDAQHPPQHQHQSQLQSQHQPQHPHQHPAQPQHYPHNMLSAERLEMEHKQRMSGGRGGEAGGSGGRAAGDADDDLDFDPFKETQKALAEMMETEMMQNTISSGDNMERVRRSRLPPPGFSHVNAYGLAAPRPQPQPQPQPQPAHQGFNTNSAMVSDWTQMDPAIMAVNFGKGSTQPQPQPQPQQAGAGAGLTQQQQELFARFNQLSVAPNGLSKLQPPLLQQWPAQHPQLSQLAQHSQHSQHSQLSQLSQPAHKLPWPAYSNIPLPPGFAPAKPPQHPAECIDAK